MTPAVPTVEWSTIRRSDDEYRFVVRDDRGKAIDITGHTARIKFRKSPTHPVAIERSTVDGSITNGGTTGAWAIQMSVLEAFPVGQYTGDYMVNTGAVEEVLFRMTLNIEESNDAPGA